MINKIENKFDKLSNKFDFKGIFKPTLTSKLLIIMYLAYLRAYSYLDDRIYQFIYGIIIISVIAITFSRYDVLAKIKKSLNI